MKQTNYHLFDFLDFDVELKRDEALWKACRPTDIQEKNGDIYITVPFQKQVKANDMQADESVARQSSTLIIRQYTHKIMRVFVAFNGEELSDNSEMLQFAPDIQKLPLTVTENDGEWLVTTPDGTRRALINLREPALDYWSDLLPAPQETSVITFWPDGVR